MHHILKTRSKTFFMHHFFSKKTQNPNPSFHLKKKDYYMPHVLKKNKNKNQIFYWKVLVYPSQ